MRFLKPVSGDEVDREPQHPCGKPGGAHARAPATAQTRYRRHRAEVAVRNGRRGRVTRMRRMIVWAAYGRIGSPPVPLPVGR